MRNRSKWAVALAAWAILVSPAAAGAQDETVEAQARFAEGLRAYKAGNYERARLNFLQSDALVRRGSVLRNLALAEMQLGRPLDALQHLHAALALSDFDAERRRIAERDLREANAATGHIAIDAKEGTKVSVDGQALDGAAPFKDPVDVMPGNHVLEGHVGAETARLEVMAPAGSVVAARLVIEEPAPAPRPLAPSVARAAPTSPPRWTCRRPEAPCSGVYDAGSASGRSPSGWR